MLPPDFTWRSIASRPDGKLDALLCDGVEVARLSQRVDDGTWYVELNRQRDRGLWRRKDCSGYEQGFAGVELWAERHQDRLRAEVRQGRRLRNALRSR